MLAIKILAYILSLFSLGGGLMLFTRLQMPAGMALLPLRSLAVALTPVEALAGLLGLLLGAASAAPVAAVLGGLGALVSGIGLYRTLATHASFEQAFGKDWLSRLPPGLVRRGLGRRGAPAGREPRWERDLPFCTIPGAERQLLCDLWQPPEGAACSGLALIYFHGSAWYMLDKDFGTRPFFRRLVAEGHTVMDVAYRLFPEAGIDGMVGDVKRAVAWMRQNAARCQVDPQRIVIGGGSAGGHIALLAAYAGDAPGLTPPELAGMDLSVRGVVSIYGPTDLEACYYHTHQDQTTRSTSPEIAQTPPPPSKMPEWMRKRLGPSARRLGFNKKPDTGAFVKLLGGHPAQAPEKYAFFSPVTHVHPGCPPTLLLLGEHDLIVPLPATLALANKLSQAEAPVVSAFYPYADHAFDLFLPNFSPTTQAAFLEIDRFLALLA
jgi:acetyl esterase/lipase